MVTNANAIESRRLELERRLEAVPGVKKVYFQPPANIKMQYDCIRYERDGAYSGFAGNLPYRFTQRYSLVVISRNPDCGIAKYIATHFPMCEEGRHFVADNLHHETLTLYF